MLFEHTMLAELLAVLEFGKVIGAVYGASEEGSRMSMICNCVAVAANKRKPLKQML